MQNTKSNYKRIGLLNFHYADNYGAVIQAWALLKVLNSINGINAEIINYVPYGYSYSVAEEEASVVSKRREKFQKFLVEQCLINTPMIHSVIGNNYDLYCVGSDQVWNTNLPEVKADYEYFLPHIDKEAKRITYAASIAKNISDEDLTLFKQYIPFFSAISLREESARNIVEEIYGRKCTHVLDPTLLLKSENYTEITACKKSKKPYLLYFFYKVNDDNLSGLGLANYLSRKYDLEIVHPFIREDCLERRLLANDGGCFWDYGIEEILGAIKDAEVIVTNSYHALTLSVMLERPVYIVPPRSMASRQIDFAKSIGIENRIVDGYRNPQEININMDYSDIREVLKVKREYSLNWLKHTIKQILVD